MTTRSTSLPNRTGGSPHEIIDRKLEKFIHDLAYPCDGKEEVPDPVPPSTFQADISHRPEKTKGSKVQEPGGNPLINVPLPREGTGFKAYKPVETEYGFSATVEFIKQLGAAWAKAYPEGPVLQIGDLAVEGGGKTPRCWGKPKLGYHKSHGSGRDFDVQIIATGNVPQKPRSIEVGDPTYDQDRTQELVDKIIKLADDKLDLILTADKKLVRGKVHKDVNHTHHLHVRLKP
jgi:murein endopeptidase